MSGRKKHTKKQRGQPSTALLSELNAIRELLNSDAESNIPLLDQIANLDTTAQAKLKPSDAALPPLQEEGLPTLCSLIDEKPMDNCTPERGQMGPELQHPLQNLPQADTDPDGQPPQREIQKSALSPQYQLPTTSAENPFLPPHIRARLTGGRVPKSNPTQPAVSATDNTEKQQQLVAETPSPSAQQQPAASPNAATKDKQQDRGSPNSHQSSPQSCRQQLIEQLVAEQLPELERLLRASIALMLDELEPKDELFRP